MGKDKPDFSTEPLPVPLLPGRQGALHAELTKLGGSSLADMYAGALKVLQDQSNPDRYALAAHNIREIANTIPRWLEVPGKALKQSEGNKVRDLHVFWDKVTKNSGCHSDGSWTGTIDSHLQSFLKRVRQFFDWRTKHRPKRKAEQKKLFRALDVSGFQVPVPLEDLNVKSWQSILNYFIGVCHHRLLHGSAEEFAGWLESFERFLLDRMRPRTFEDHDDIDELIGRDDQDGDS